MSYPLSGYSGGIIANGISFFKGPPRGSTALSTAMTDEGITLFSWVTPARRQGRQAVHMRIVSKMGETASIVKRNYDPAGKLIHTKVKK